MPDDATSIEYGLRNPQTGEWSPLETYQQEFLDACVGKRFCTFGGGKGSGKTSTILYKLAKNAVTALNPSLFPRPLDPPYTILFAHHKEEYVYSAIFRPFFSILPREIPNPRGGAPISLVLDRFLLAAGEN